MRKSQEANDSVTIEQEQADQVRRTVGATLAARALEEVLPAIGKGYAPQAHRKAAEKISENMDTDPYALLEESLMYVEECEQFHKPGCRTLSKRIRAALSAARGEGRGG